MTGPNPRTPQRPTVAAKQMLAKASIDDPVVAGVVTPKAPPQPATDLTKLTIRLDRELLGRVRAAFVLDGLAAGHTSLSAWISSVLDGRVRQVEHELNDGAPLTPLGVNRLPKGRLS